MTDFIVKYWVEWILGLIALGLGTLAKYFHSLYKRDKLRELKDHDKEFQDQVETVRQQLLKDGEEMLLQTKREIAEETAEKQEHLSQKLIEYQQTSDAHYHEVIDKFTAHIKTADGRYEEMFSTLTSQVNNLRKESESSDVQLNSNINLLADCINVVKDGMLNIQGKDFKKACRELLTPDYVITSEDFEEISEAHDVYNKLGGNHAGDRLFELVEEKYKKTL